MTFTTFILFSLVILSFIHFELVSRKLQAATLELKSETGLTRCVFWGHRSRVLRELYTCRAELDILRDEVNQLRMQAMDRELDEMFAHINMACNDTDIDHQ